MDRRDTYNGYIAESIRRMRRQHGWSQEQLVAKLQTLGIDYTRARISQVERKKRPPAAVLIVALRHLFGCAYHDFFAEIEAEYDELTR